jgi:hypothetical protein
MSNNTNLSGLISAAVTAKMTPDFIEKEVNARVDKLIVETVERALRSYSDVGREIERAVQEALRVDRLDLPSYGETVTKILKTQIESRVSEVVSGRLSADMEELLNLAPKEIKLSHIADEMRKKHEDNGKYGDVITVRLEETDYGSAWLCLDEEQHHEPRDRYKCAHRLLLNKDGTIYSATVDQRPLKDTQHIGRSYGLAQKIRAWVACGTRIELDVDAVCTSIAD